MTYSSGFTGLFIIDAVFLTIALSIAFVAGIAIYYDYGGSLLIGEYTIGPCIDALSNLVFLNTIVLFLIHKLFNGLHETVTEQEPLKQELHENKEDLGYSVTLLNEKNRVLKVFAYIRSHDLKEPLRMICSFIDLLSKGYNEILDEKGRTYIISGIRQKGQIK